MDIILGYAISVASVLAAPILLNLIRYARPSAQQGFKYLTYPYLLRRHHLLGPWTVADVLLQLVFIACNCFCLGFRIPFSNILQAGIRAGSLSLINLIPLFLGPHISFLADIFGISLNNFRKMHRSAGFMSCGLVIVHIVIMLRSRTEVFRVQGASNISAVVVWPQICQVRIFWTNIV